MSQSFAGSGFTSRTLVNVVAQATTPKALAAGDSGNTYTNEGASAQIVFTLPPAVANLVFAFIVNDDDGIRVTANTGDTIRLGATVSKAAGYIENAVIGSVIKLTAINATEWIAEYWVGTWTVETA